MLRVSKLTDYASLIVAELIRHPKSNRSASQISEATHLPYPTVSKLLKLLCKAGLLDSFKGVTGGYRLARAPKDISLAELITAVEGPYGMTECSQKIGSCQYEDSCGVKPQWNRVDKIIYHTLEKITMADFSEESDNDDEIAIQLNLLGGCHDR